jgi:hypothetical protein
MYVTLFRVSGHVNIYAVDSKCMPGIIWTLLACLLARAFAHNDTQILECGDVHPNPGPTNHVDPSQKLLTIFHVNAQSLRYKVDFIHAETHLKQYDIIAISETWLNDNVDTNDILLEGYNEPIRRDRIGRMGGGVCTYVREGVPCQHRVDLETDGVDFQWFQMCINKKSIFICVGYNPDGNDGDFWESFDDSNQSVARLNPDGVIMVVDFNNDFLVPNQINFHLKEIMFTYNLTQIVDQPTRITPTSISLIDVIIVSNSDFVNEVNVYDNFCSDHNAISCSFNFYAPLPVNNYLRTIWNYELANYDMIMERMRLIDVDALLYESIDFNEMVLKWSSQICDIISELIPHKVVRFRTRDKLWMTPEILKLISKRKKLHKIAVQTNKPAQWEAFRKQRNVVKDKVRSAKREYDVRMADKVNKNPSCGKLWWKVVKETSRFGKKTVPIPLIKNTVTGDLTSKPAEMADIFNQLFTSIQTALILRFYNL